MKIKTGLIAVATVLSLAACKPAETTTEAAAEVAAPAEETAAQIAARIEASMSPLDYALQKIMCNQAIMTAQRAPEGVFDAELTAKVASATRLPFGKTVSAARELGADAKVINTKQHSGLPLPQNAAASTPEYVAQAKECLAILDAETAKLEAAA